MDGISFNCEEDHCDYIDGPPRALECQDWRWIFPEQIADLAFPKANHKLFNKIHERLA